MSTDKQTGATINGCRQSLRPVNEGVVSKIRDQLIGQTDESLMGKFGISYNTWRKVRSGEPIRRSVAERLEHRLGGAN